MHHRPAVVGRAHVTACALSAFLVSAAALAGCTGPEDVPLTAKEALGKQLFEDANLSEPRGQACASCHDPNAGFAGSAGSPLAAVARGSRPDQLGGRNVPTAMYASFSPRFGFERDVDDKGATRWVPTGGQFWDGRASSLAEQAKGPFLNPREMNNPDAAAVVAKVRASGYAAEFREVYGEHALEDDAAAFDLVADALAAFESSHVLQPFSSKFDAFLRGSEALEERELRGLALFTNPEKGNCIACHAGDTGSRTETDWLFTDHTYDNLGLPRNRALPDNHDARHMDLGLCEQPGLEARLPAGVASERLCGAFKVPTLRNVERTAPYGHNGVFATLDDVVRFYVTRETNPERWYPVGADGKPAKYDDLPAAYHGNVNRTEAPYDRKPGEAPRLDEEEIGAVVAFLRTLTDR